MSKDTGKKIIEYLQSQKYRIRAYNIVYIEGVDPDTFALNDDQIDYWNDVRSVIRDDGEILLCAQATTEPGLWYTKNRLNVNGAARIAFGQHLEAWTFGKHHEQDALVQCGKIKVYRDRNEDGFRTNDPIDVGEDFAINQHTTFQAPESIGKWSAGCLVGRYPQTHAKFLQLCKDSGNKVFDTTVLDGSELHKLQVI
ncbi:hypothetical protein [Dendronalium sp. ChiSLP03b]|uniref:hypothetical protein n=1 Tax=Dendronalium sp. ChiSLP03b TaxID=3075381 RepID=UPI002AD3173D|nr:hypothetical protein [Dendronalium sp. ChiSLP03b]MDZ8203632.1 hypothetical protein [Dendronalium sp. ChiSLP03b]